MFRLAVCAYFFLILPSPLIMFRLDVAATFYIPPFLAPLRKSSITPKTLTLTRRHLVTLSVTDKKHGLSLQNSLAAIFASLL
jgi:hypothetical protein